MNVSVKMSPLWLVSFVTIAFGACTPDLEALRNNKGVVGGTDASLGGTSSVGGFSAGGTSGPLVTGGASSTANTFVATGGASSTATPATGGNTVTTIAGGSSSGGKSSDCATCATGGIGGVSSGGMVATGGTSASPIGGQSSATGGLGASGGAPPSSGGTVAVSGGSSSTGGTSNGTGGFTGPCFVETQAPSPSIIHYKFDDGSGTSAADSSGNARDATLQGVGWSTSGRFNGAINFNGASQSVRLPNNIINGASEVTVAAWVKLTATPSGSALFDIGSAATNHFYMKVGGTGVSVGAQTDAGTAEELVTTYALPLGVWKHLAASVSGGQFLLYIDGLLVAQKATAFVPSALGATTSNQLGLLIGGTVNLYGLVDDFRVYDRALSRQELEALAPPGTDYYHFNFDEACGAQAHDSSDAHLLADLPAQGTWTPGRIGGSLSLDRTYGQYLSLPQGLLATCSDLTVALWVLRTSPQNWERIFVFGQGLQTSMTLAAANTSGIMQFAAKQNGSSVRGYDEQLLISTSTSQSPQSGLWAHVAVVLQSGTGRLYFNGTQVNSGTISNLPSGLGVTPINTFGQPLYLQEPSYAGRLDDLRIACRAFNPNEIKILALAGQ